MDIVNLASQREQDERERALRAFQAQRSLQPSASHCMDCEGAIPVARQQAVLGVQRCIECQVVHEHRSK